METIRITPYLARFAKSALACALAAALAAAGLCQPAWADDGDGAAATVYAGITAEQAASLVEGGEAVEDVGSCSFLLGEWTSAADLYAAGAEELTLWLLEDGSYVLVVSPALDFTEDEDGAVEVVEADGECTAVALPASFVALGSDDDGEGLQKFVTPTIEKSVLEGGVWADSADASLGEDVRYRLVGTLPSNWDDYDYYYYCFCDEGDGSAVVDPGSVEVSLVDAGTGEAVDVTSAFEVSYSDFLLTVECADLKAVDAFAEAEYGDEVIVEYTARLSAAALKVGTEEGNVNYAYLVYTSKAFTDALGKSVEDTATVYSWTLQILKLSASDGAALAGAEFTVLDVGSGLYLDGEGGLTKKAAALAVGDDGLLTLAGVDSGDYVLEEVAAPEGYEAAGTFTLTLSVSTDEAGTTTLSAEVDNGAVEVSGVQAEAGIVQISVSDEESPAAAASQTASDLAQTGGAQAAAAALLALAAALLAAWALCRGRGKEGAAGRGGEE